jgi:hypothetical protein
MTRIVYLLLQTERLTGGQKVAVRHVEALRELGFDAVLGLPEGAQALSWLRHSAPSITRRQIRSDDVLVLPEDGLDLLRQLASSPHRKIVFIQNQFYAGAVGLLRLAPAELARYTDIAAGGPVVADWAARYLPHARVSTLQPQIDPDQFRPAAKKPVIACAPRKRPIEYRYIREAFRHRYRGPNTWQWVPLQNMTEEQVGRALGSASIFLSLNRMEASGLTSLEAMASACLCVGFTGIGAREYASPVNGLWVDEDDCEAAATALVEAAEMASSGSSRAGLMREAAVETAARYSRPAFMQALESFWRERVTSRLAPAPPTPTPMRSHVI